MPAMLTHYGRFSFCMGEKDGLKTASSLRREPLPSAFYMVWQIGFFKIFHIFLDKGEGGCYII